MSVDLIGIFKHKLSAAEAFKLPEIIDTWEEAKKLKPLNSFMGAAYRTHQLNTKAHWIPPQPFSPADLERLWDSKEKEQSIPGLYNKIECFLGHMYVFRHTIALTHFPEHKYGNIQTPAIARQLFHLNRAVARALQTDKILYCPDSSFPTSILEEKAKLGMPLEALEAYGIAQFGTPPAGLSEGRKNFFFIDQIDEEMGEISEWEDWEGYWTYNEEKQDYEQVRKGE